MGGQAPYGYDEAHKIRELGSPEHPILSELLDTVGDGSGDKDMATTADVYLTQPPEGQIYVVDSLYIVITDGGAIDINGWGSLAALVTGCKLDIMGGTTPESIHDFTNGVTLKQHGHLARLGKITYTTSALGCIIKVNVCGNYPFRLDGDRNESITFETQDDLSALTSMEVVVHGRSFFGKG